MTYNLDQRAERLAKQKRAAKPTMSPDRIKQAFGRLGYLEEYTKTLDAERTALKADLLAAQNERDEIAGKLDATRTETFSMLESQKRIIAEQEKKLEVLQTENDRLTNLLETRPAERGAVIFEGYLTAQQIQQITNKKAS